MKLIDIFGTPEDVNEVLMFALTGIAGELLNSGQIEKATRLLTWYQDQITEGTTLPETVTEQSQGVEDYKDRKEVFRQSFFTDVLFEMLPTYWHRWAGWVDFSNRDLRPDITLFLQKAGKPVPRSQSEWQRLSDALKRCHGFRQVSPRRWECCYVPPATVEPLFVSAPTQHTNNGKPEPSEYSYNI